MVVLAGHHYPFLPVRWLLRHRFDSIGRAPGIRTPLLAIAGERDEVIPPGSSRRLYDAWGGAKRWVVIPEANHNDLGQQRSFWGPILAFLGVAHAG
jgi:pimeloyl-ACP methyl ester carboxylesterase